MNNYISCYIKKQQISCVKNITQQQKKTNIETQKNTKQKKKKTTTKKNKVKQRQFKKKTKANKINNNIWVSDSLNQNIHNQATGF